MTGMDWMHRAACKGMSVDLFFGPEGERRTDREHREEHAKQVCDHCPVWRACLDDALARGDVRNGVRGRMNPEEREAERRRRRRRAAA